MEIFLPLNFLVSDDKKSENFINLYVVLCPLLIHIPWGFFLTHWQLQFSYLLNKKKKNNR